MSGLAIFRNSIIDEARKHKGHILIREQHCLGCREVLAIEITDKLGKRGDYWVVKDALRTRFGIDFLYSKEVWFGNFIKCPKCGREGKLPMDKPLSAENIASPKEEVKHGETQKVLKS